PGIQTLSVPTYNNENEEEEDNDDDAKQRSIELKQKRSQQKEYRELQAKKQKEEQNKELMRCQTIVKSHQKERERLMYCIQILPSWPPDPLKKPIPFLFPNNHHTKHECPNDVNTHNDAHSTNQNGYIELIVCDATMEKKKKEKKRKQEPKQKQKQKQTQTQQIQIQTQTQKQKQNQKQKAKAKTESVPTPSKPRVSLLSSLFTSPLSKAAFEDMINPTEHAMHAIDGLNQHWTSTTTTTTMSCDRLKKKPRLDSSLFVEKYEESPFRNSIYLCAECNECFRIRVHCNSRTNRYTLICPQPKRKRTVKSNSSSASKKNKESSVKSSAGAHNMLIPFWNRFHSIRYEFSTHGGDEHHHYLIRSFKSNDIYRLYDLDVKMTEQLMGQSAEPYGWGFLFCKTDLARTTALHWRTLTCVELLSQHTLSDQQSQSPIESEPVVFFFFFFF
ncbi:hypothetical protein RFI_14488, partial [Reticulomyxa filosa]